MTNPLPTVKATSSDEEVNGLRISLGSMAERARYSCDDVLYQARHC
jgi:hypothetical protein